MDISILILEPVKFVVRAVTGNFLERLSERWAVERVFQTAVKMTVDSEPQLRETNLAKWLRRSPVRDAFVGVRSKPRLEFNHVMFSEMIESSKLDLKSIPASVPEFVDKLIENFLSELHSNQKTSRFYLALKLPKDDDRPAMLSWDPPVDIRDSRDNIERPEIFKKLKSVIVGGPGYPVNSITLLHGMPGFGKTTLVFQLCADSDIRRTFPDGLLWVVLGQSPNLAVILGQMFEKLTGRSPGFVNESEAATAVSSRLSGLRCLIVVDDVWNLEHLKPFLHGGGGCARVVTSRVQHIIEGATPVCVEKMSESEAVHLLEAKIQPHNAADHQSELRRLAGQLGGWPLLLALTGSTLRNQLDKSGSDLSAALTFVEQELSRHGPTAFDNSNEGARNRAFRATVELSLALLEPAAHRKLLELSIFPNDVAIPREAAALLWGQTYEHAEELFKQLHDFALLRYDSRAGTANLHEMMRTHFAHLLSEPDQITIHKRLVDAYADRVPAQLEPDHPNSVAGATVEWWQLPVDEQYPWLHLAYHMVRADRIEALRQLLLDFRWIEAKADVAGLPALLSDFAGFPPNDPVTVVAGALRLAGHVIGNDPGQLRSQIVGRLLGIERQEVRNFVREATNRATGPWLRPLSPALVAPTGSLVRTLAGHSAGVSALAVSNDGQLIATGDWSGTVRVWDIESGAVLSERQAHAGGVSAIAMTAKTVVSGSWDGSLFAWDTQTGDARKLVENAGVIHSVVMTTNGQILAGMWDGTVRVWDGAKLNKRCPVAHAGEVTALAVASDGRTVISGSAEGRVKEWNLFGDTNERKLAGHRDGINMVAITRNGHLLVSGSDSGAVTLYSKGTQLPRSLVSPVDGVTSLAVTPDGRRAISGCRKGSLTVWSLESGSTECTLPGHADAVTVLAVTWDGERAISGSRDGTVKIWDLNAKPHDPGWPQHVEAVCAVAVTPDGSRAVTGAQDGVVKVWNMRTGMAVREFSGPNPITALAVSQNGDRVVACFAKEMVKAWDTTTWMEISLDMRADEVHTLSVSEEGYVVLVCADGSVRRWDAAADGTACALLMGPSDFDMLAVTRDGRFVISGIRDGMVKVTDLKTGAEKRLSGTSAELIEIVSTSDGHCVVLLSRNERIVLCDVNAGTERGSWSLSDTGLAAVTLTPDQHLVVASLKDAQLRVRPMSKPDPSALFTGDAALQCCAMTPDGIHFVVGDHFGRVHFLVLDDRGHK
jgi:WD40 repeat protein